MSIRYAVTATTGLNTPSDELKHIAELDVLWVSFADAKAEVVTRAEAVHESLISSDCDYEVHSESGVAHYEVWFEYGPASSDPTLPFKTVLRVHRFDAGVAIGE